MSKTWTIKNTDGRAKYSKVNDEYKPEKLWYWSQSSFVYLPSAKNLKLLNISSTIFLFLLFFHHFSWKKKKSKKSNWQVFPSPFTFFYLSFCHLWFSFIPCLSRAKGRKVGNLTADWEILWWQTGWQTRKTDNCFTHFIFFVKLLVCILSPSQWPHFMKLNIS